MKTKRLSLLIAAIVATLLISITSTQGQALAEEKIAGVTVYSVTPANINPANKNRLFVHTHGGAYVLNGGRAGLTEAVLVAHRANISR